MPSPTQAEPALIMRTESALIERLVQAAAAAIRNEAPTINADPAGLRGLVLDMKIQPAGRLGAGITVAEATAYVERRSKLRIRGER